MIILPSKRGFTTKRLEGGENNAMKQLLLGEIETHGSDCWLEWGYSKDQQTVPVSGSGNRHPLQLFFCFC